MPVDLLEVRRMGHLIRLLEANEDSCLMLMDLWRTVEDVVMLFGL